MTKFMYWLKTNVGRIPMTEYTAQEMLDGLRAEQEHFLDLSFGDICAFGPNAAMMHYSADPETAAQILPEGMLLWIPADITWKGLRILPEPLSWGRLRRR